MRYGERIYIEGIQTLFAACGVKARKRKAPAREPASIRPLTDEERRRVDDRSYPERNEWRPFVADSMKVI